MKATGTINTPDAILKAHGKVSLVSAVSVSRLHRGRIRLTFTNDNGHKMAGGLIVSPASLQAIARAARKARRGATAMEET